MSTVLGIKMVGHDTGAAIWMNGKIVAIAEERLVRLKHSYNVFPRRAITYCLDAVGLVFSAVDLVVIDRVGLRHDPTLRRKFTAETNGSFNNARLETVNHHDAHAAAAFYPSGFTDAAVLVYDGAGERTLTRLGVHATETETLYHGVGHRLEMVQKTVHAREGRIFPHTFGIGKLYSLLSNDYLGFGPYNQGKMMGLAPYGDLSLLEQIPEGRWFRNVAGHILCNPHLEFPPLPAMGILGRIKALSSAVGGGVAKLAQRTRQVATKRLGNGLISVPSLFQPIRLPGPPRRPGGELPDAYYASVARAGQHIMEQVAIGWGKRLRNMVDSTDLCVAGGLGLNIDANRNFLDCVGYRRLFVQPAASDTGIALGCALWGAKMILGEECAFTMNHAFLGRAYSEMEIGAALEEHAEHVDVSYGNHVVVAVTDLLCRGEIGAWFEGGSEYGPRALGHRSIIADPRRPEMKDILNRRVKHREAWRPFGCSILLERLADYFELTADSPFMLLAARARAGIRETIPSVVHVDNTSRIQTLTQEQNGRFYHLVSDFGRRTGVPVLLNTSFNMAGDPIVETPNDALETFLRTDLDFLVMEDHLIIKRRKQRVR